MNKRGFLLLPLLLSLLLIFACNKPSSYTIRLQNVSSGPVRVKVELVQAYAAPGQNLVQMDKTVLQGQYLEVYHNEGVGISLPLRDNSDSLLKYLVKVTNADTIPIKRNMGNINNYILTTNKKAKSYLYQTQIFISDFE